ncbi:MazG nucleotide pyrophosphohydrolase domain-containing protein [Anaerococcus degeneri]|uniref:MazG-like family protein n=1 Tax=Anaerococcus degeneri TaxID=361500 RepID=A0ABS7Z004_9FIRM|nr:MazG nucleotide pyrophosphohydrolase domain-containing protein [Anaerococcus degeneri]MBP2015725.1 NTP pyrophosphatase (non-canonical NTP hydrolase) [Anaerococcus degeneri]MCA2096086.1 MazG-like family protein [Anaerococcus degeneri]
MRRLEELKAGEVFKFGKFEWIKLADLDEGVLAITKKHLPVRRRVSEDGNNWKNAELRKWLNINFYNALIDNGASEEDFLFFERDLKALDGQENYGTCIDKISLLSAEEFERYKGFIPFTKDWWRILTPDNKGKNKAYYNCVIGEKKTISCHIPQFIGQVHPVCRIRSDKEVEEITITGKIKNWIRDRNLDTADPKGQMLKLVEETGELAEGLAKNRPDQVKDSIGDIYVVLTALSMQLGYSIEDCIEEAYEEIKDRKGRMVNGIFVKESDL